MHTDFSLVNFLCMQSEVLVDKLPRGESCPERIFLVCNEHFVCTLSFAAEYNQWPSRFQLHGFGLYGIIAQGTSQCSKILHVMIPCTSGFYNTILWWEREKSFHAFYGITTTQICSPGYRLWPVTIVLFAKSHIICCLDSDIMFAYVFRQRAFRTSILIKYMTTIS